MQEDIDIFYNEFVDNLNEGDQCALILGPELAVNDSGVGYKKFFKNLMKDEKNGAYYFHDENLFHFNNDSNLERRKKYKIKEFYKNVGDKVLLEMIARIRFPLIINVCPDDSLYRILKEKGEQNITFEYFSAKIPQYDLDSTQNHNKPSPNTPIIYNIFGSIKKDQSLVLTYRDLFDTIEHLIPEGSLPNHIESYLKNTSTFIFLGFTFDSWYYQLVCHKLRIFEKGTRKPTLTTSSTSIFNHVMLNHFEMIFTKENPTQSIERITRLCQEKEYNHLLRDQLTFDNLSLFISYAWGDEESSSADWATITSLIKKFFKEKNISVQFLVDRDTLTYGDSIDSFMTRIGQGKSVVQVISDKYLKSVYCMTEALRISLYEDDGNKNFSRIFQIRWNDIQEIEVYKEYWKNRFNEVFERIDKTISDPVERQKIKNEHMIYLDIHDYIETFHKSIKDKIGLNIAKEDFALITEGELSLKEKKNIEFTKFMETLVSSMKKSS